MHFTFSCVRSFHDLCARAQRRGNIGCESVWYFYYYLLFVLFNLVLFIFGKRLQSVLYILFHFPSNICRLVRYDANSGVCEESILSFVILYEYKDELF